MPDSKTLTPFIFLAVAALIFYGGVRQQLSVAQTLGAQVSRAEQALKEAQGGNAEQDQLIHAWQQLDGALKDRVNLGLPSQDDAPNLLVLLDNAATQSGLLLENIAITEEAQKTAVQPSGSAAPSASSATVIAKPQQSVLLSVNARGEYSSMKAFVQSIQKEERIMDMQSIDISPFSSFEARSATSAGKTNKIFELSATIKAYYGR